MSKVKIQGNASGTGIFTVAAPATNTDRTLTLPDVDATVLTSAGGTINGKVIIDGTQAVGSSSAANLTEVTTIYAQKYAPLRNSSSYGLYTGPAGLNAAYFQVAATDASAGGVLQLNPYGGYVTASSQPAFYARHTTNSNYSANSYITGPWTVTYDRRNNFNSSNGTFTAPIGGIYQVNIMLGNYYPSGIGNYQVHVNNSFYAGFQYDPASSETGWFTNVLCGAISINANDTVRINTGGSAASPDNSSWSSWSMVFLG